MQLTSGCAIACAANAGASILLDPRPKLFVDCCQRYIDGLPRPRAENPFLDTSWRWHTDEQATVALTRARACVRRTQGQSNRPEEELDPVPSAIPGICSRLRAKPARIQMNAHSGIRAAYS